MSCHARGRVEKDRPLDHHHFHGDHYGGAAMLANLMPIGTVHDNGIPKKNPDRHRRNPIFPQLIKPYRDMKLENRHIVQPGYDYPLKQAKGSARLRVTCVAANQKTIQPPSNVRLPRNPLTGTVPEKPEDLSDNANSVATLFTFGDFSFFDGGDITWNVEAKLVTPFNLISPLAGKVDVFQINHHGLDSSNNPVLIQSLSPTVVIFNNGHKKGCNEGSFQASKSAKSVQAIWQVHKNLREDAHNNTEEVLMANLTDSKNCKGHFIKLRSLRTAIVFEFTQQRRQIPFHPIRKVLSSSQTHPADAVTPETKAIRPGRSGFRQPHRHHRRPTPRL